MCVRVCLLRSLASIAKKGKERGYFCQMMHDVTYFQLSLHWAVVDLLSRRWVREHSLDKGISTRCNWLLGCVEVKKQIGSSMRITRSQCDRKRYSLLGSQCCTEGPRELRGPYISSALSGTFEKSLRNSPLSNRESARACL